MTHEVFISYSSYDKPIADAVCAHMEGTGIRCWIAPRDILPGEDWPTAITNAISQSRVMVLVFSARSNSSEDVSRELMLAANHKLVIVPFKIENIVPEPGKQYYLARTHWLDAVNPPTREQISLLGETVKVFVANAVRAEEARAVSDNHPESQVAISPVPLQAQPPVKMTNLGKKWGPWLYILVAVVLIAIVFGSRLFTSPATPSVEPTASNTSIPSQLTMDVTVSDPFDNNEYHWPVLQQLNDNGNFQDMQVLDGELDWKIDCILIDGCYYSVVPTGMPAVSDFALSVDVRRIPETTTGYGGMIFRFVNGSNYYMFVYNDADGTFLIWKAIENSITFVANWKTSSAINSSQFNRLGVEALGSSFNFFINGIKVYSAEITGISSGRVGLGGGNFTSGKINLVFDNFELSGATSR